MKIKETEFNGRKVSIIFTSFNEGEFNFFALDEKKKIVAKCSFDLIGSYIHQLPTKSKNATIPTSTAIQNSCIKFEKPFGIISGDQIEINKQNQIFKNGKLFLLQDTYCKLRLIEICDKKFYKVGLGTELFKLMESFAIQQNCTKISAWVYPFGDFGMGTLKFYNQNGFTFAKDPTDHTIGTKELKIKIQQTEQTFSK